MAMEQTIKTKKVGLDLLPDGPDRRLELLRDGPERRLKLLSDRTGGKRKEVRDYSLILFILFLAKLEFQYFKVVFIL